MGYSLVGTLASSVMAIRVWSIYQKSSRIALALSVLIGTSLTIEFVANLYIQRE